eukprot:TRINITY_DN10815_c0_g1_i2.p1 TRINITY_DN10815_c0_g1~~TRINITY_DN10815_c0_g1_i2.p1  ORF type:complete len:241 (+),score=47.71 TRINITY_DN10815_c0_g1_i2:181-903(+)
MCIRDRYQRRVREVKPKAMRSAMLLPRNGPLARSLSTAASPVPVFVAGCGVPNKSMGWYHATQLLDMPAARLTTVLEPWFISEGANAPGADEFKEFRQTLEDEHGVRFTASFKSVPQLEDPTLVLIGARTSDCPAIFHQALEQGATHIYLEKPGATSVDDMERMREAAQELKVPVYMGYNKNVARYVTEAIDFQANSGADDTLLTLIHNNHYQKSDLPECFERNSEGILQNMVASGNVSC